jgi:large subunit ribosomal protein L21
MYAVIATGGKQYRVEPGQTLEVELLGVETDAEVTLRPVMVVDGDTVVAGGRRLEGASVTARVVGEAKGEKIRGFTYKSKANQRKRWGHRQRYSVIEITAISAG